MYAIEIALAKGASRVIYIDTDEERLRLASELGAETVEGPPPHRTGPFPITVDASATHEGLACAIRSTEPGGACTHTGILPEAETPIPLFEMYTNGIEFYTGRVMARPLMPGILDLTSAGDLHPERVTSKVVAWNDAADAVSEPETKLVVAR
jgi:alcohol dehydrogenase